VPIVIEPAGVMHELRPFPGVAAVVYVILRNFGICALAAYPVFEAGSDGGRSAFMVGASGVIVLGCLVVLARDLLRCCPMVLDPHGFVRAGWRSTPVAECQRIVIRHRHKGHYQTILQTRRRDIWVNGHGCTRNDVDHARRVAQILQVGAYKDSGGKLRKLRPWS
jgi:hypothetical protein